MERIILKTDAKRFNQIFNGKSFSVPVEIAVRDYIATHRPHLVQIMTGYPNRTRATTRLFAQLVDHPELGWLVKVHKTDCRDCIHYQAHQDCPYQEFSGCDGYTHFQFRNNSVRGVQAV